MFAQWGQFLLCLTLALTVWQLLAGGLALTRGRIYLYHSVANAVVLQLLCVLLAFVILAGLMVAGDYSLPYVWQNTNDQLSWYYRLAATWSAHEGSMLLWLLMLSVSALIALLGSRAMSLRFRCIMLVTIAAVSAGITAFILFASNPLAQAFPPLTQGRDLNPLLQDPGLIFHPPLLYVGYVSTVIVFAAAIAGLCSGELDRKWAAWLRPYSLFSWIFLSCGIALGSYWAYYELGWGGWWFWDPVENASFMPWLMMTALVHALAVASRQGRFLGWCALLAICAFGLSMLGAFLVRSGVLVSVHSFATDPERGVIILTLMTVYLLPSLMIFLLRVPPTVHRTPFTFLSTESAVLFNNLLLCAACSTVFLGTLYPLALELLTEQRISVGPPYYNATFVPLMLPLLLLIGVVGFIRWGRDSFPSFGRRLLPFLGWWAATIGVLLVVLWLTSARLILLAAIGLALWVMLGTVASYVSALRTRKVSSSPSSKGRLGVHGMHLAHFGLGVFVLAVVLVSNLSVSRETAMKVGDNVQLGNYQFTLDRIEDRTADNYLAKTATVLISEQQRPILELNPERRLYHSQPDNPMTEAAIASLWFGDLFVALTGAVDDQHWGMRLQVKPGVYWIWLGVLMMAIGGALAMGGHLSTRRSSP